MTPLTPDERASINEFFVAETNEPAPAGSVERLVGRVDELAERSAMLEYYVGELTLPPYPHGNSRIGTANHNSAIKALQTSTRALVALAEQLRSFEPNSDYPDQNSR